MTGEPNPRGGNAADENADATRAADHADAVPALPDTPRSLPPYPRAEVVAMTPPDPMHGGECVADLTTRRECDRQIMENKRRLDVLESQLAATIMLLEPIKQNTDEIREIFKAVRALLHVGRMLGIAGKWVAQVAGGVAVIWLLFRYGVTEIIEHSKCGKP